MGFFRHVPRELNLTTDHLSKQGTAGHPLFWFLGRDLSCFSVLRIWFDGSYGQGGAFASGIGYSIEGAWIPSEARLADQPFVRSVELEWIFVCYGASGSHARNSMLAETDACCEALKAVTSLARHGTILANPEGRVVNPVTGIWSSQM